MTFANELALAWFREGLSYTQIAHRLASEHGITKSRNAIAGYVSRGRAAGGDFKDRRSAITRAAALKRAKHQKEQKAQQPRKKPVRREPIIGVEFAAPPPVFDEASVPRGALAITGLTPMACCWPIGDPKEDDFRYCCLPAEGRYCPEHTKLGIQTRSERAANTNIYKSIIQGKKRSKYA